MDRDKEKGEHKRGKEIMCKQLLMHMLEKMGYCSCFRWTRTSLHQLNSQNNNNNNNNNINNTNIAENDTEFKSIAISVIIPPSSSFDGAMTNEESMLESSIPKDVTGSKNEAQTFNYRELATATNNFRSELLIGEGGFGPVYRGKLERTGQVVAVKKLNQTGIQGEKEFLVEVLMLSLLRHPNLVNLIGYCAEGNQRLLVYEYLPLGSLANHLHDLPSDASPLDWNTRMKIAVGAAEGLDYLHNKAEPSVIYRDLKSANILLDDGFRPKLSDFGLAKFGPEGDKSHVSTRVMGTQGYCAPEYAITGKLTKMSDIFSFGVVLLELITGQQAIDPTRGNGKHLLVDWAHSIIDSKNFLLLADPKLKGQFPEDVLSKAVEVASMCVRENPHSRPNVSEIVLAFKYLSSRHYNPNEVRSLEKGEKIRKKPHEDDHVNDDTDLTKINKDLERKLAVADAKMWGETWREKRRITETEADSLAR